LEDLNNANGLEPNNAFIFNNSGDVKRMLKDYQGALEDFQKANVLQPNNGFILKSLKDVKNKIMKEPWRILTR
jgi:tetratricopeptide (TPR) repeat protein